MSVHKEIKRITTHVLAEMKLKGEKIAMLTAYDYSMAKLVDQAGRTMEEVVASIKRVARIMADISDASREQSAGIEQVSLAVSQMDEVTQQNAALVEEAAAAAESLEEQAYGLSQAVSIFRLSESGKVAHLDSRPLPQASGSAPETHASADRMGSKKRPSLPATLDDEWEEF